MLRAAAGPPDDDGAAANVDEANQFMAGRKQALIFSQAGATGRSYHASKDCENRKRRVHYLLEAGWRADAAIQGLGRTHRTHQTSASIFRPVTTDVRAERRFISTIARRLDALGAITRGQANAQSSIGEDQALFHASDNLESPYARKALRQLLMQIGGGMLKGWTEEAFTEHTGLKCNPDVVDMPTFLNRVLALRIDEQNTLFAVLDEHMDQNIAEAVESGQFHLGVTDVRADSTEVAGRDTLSVDPATGARTELVELRTGTKFRPLTPEEGMRRARRAAEQRQGEPPAPCMRIRRRKVEGESRFETVVDAALLTDAPARIHDDGSIEHRVRLETPEGPRTQQRHLFRSTAEWQPCSEDTWERLWRDEMVRLPRMRHERLWLITGLLLPHWQRIPQTNMKVRRTTTVDGTRLIGLCVGVNEVNDVRAAFDLPTSVVLSASDTWKKVMEGNGQVRIGEELLLRCSRVMGLPRLEVTGNIWGKVADLKRRGARVDVIRHRTRVFVPDEASLGRLLERYRPPSSGSAGVRAASRAG